MCLEPRKVIIWSYLHLLPSKPFFKFLKVSVLSSPEKSVVHPC